METLTLALVCAVALLGVLVVLGSRRRRDDGLEPVRLGPAWEPSGGPAVVSDTPDPRVEVLQQQTGCDPDTIATVLTGWDEHLAVLGFLSLPASHRYRVYDPYDPPVASRGADNEPVPDPARVMRDVARRTGTAEVDARVVLDALLGREDDGTTPVDQRS